MQDVDLLKRYKFLRTVGIGSFGKVKLAIHLATQMKVAVKILTKESISKKNMRVKINREIEITRKLDHPHVCKLFEVIETDYAIYLVMEYAERGELFDYVVERGRVPEVDARRFFQQIISAVDYLHSQDVVHRDLKPENILLDADNNVKVIDFGLSNQMDDGQFLKSSVGSPNYAAPEVVSGEHYVGPEIDCWSCGVILYALVVGRLPFAHERYPVLYQMIRDCDFTIPPFVSRGCRRLISKILVRHPIDRANLVAIREFPWFQAHLPRYLSEPMPAMAPKFKVNVETLEATIRAMREPRPVPVLIAELEACRRSRQNSPFAVTYHILLSTREADFLRVQQTLGEAHSPEVKAHSPRETEELPMFPDECRPRVDWMFGIESSLRPQMIFEEVYDCLTRHGMLWKVAGDFHLHCVKRAELQFKEPVTLSLRLFRKRAGLYVLDMQRVCGDSIRFLRDSVLIRDRLRPRLCEG